MAKKKKKVEEETEVTKVNENMYMVAEKDKPDLKIMFASYFTVEAELEGKVALFFNEEGELLAAFRDWFCIKKVDPKQEIKRVKNISELLEENVQYSKDLPEGWGKVNGQDF
jgi:hypothetical protein